ncbi:MAG TPA: CRTAC1 family protein [Pyrinomonadaceae bacterium]|nr:CRTAC1 family protein [Pyrinomonadaceae bacterium]
MAISSNSIPTIARRTRSTVRYLTWRRVGLILLATVLGAGLYFRYQYRGFTAGLYNQTRYASIGENKNLWFCLSYWLEYMQLLKFNDSTGFYSFDNVDESAMSAYERGKLAYHRGDFGTAVSLIELDINQSGESEDKLFWLAMSYMRQAEAQNCLAKLDRGTQQLQQNHILAHVHENQMDSMQQFCALPITQFHTRTESARAAAKLFEKLLDRYDHQNRLYQWLLNFNYMTVNGFPQEVPPKYLINTKFIDTFYGERKKQTEAEFASISFDDRAHEMGVDTFNSGKGVAVEDFDHDGYLDIVTGGNFDSVKFYKNDDGRKFIDRTEAAGLGGIKQPFVITSADYDNDGWPDLFFARPFGNYALFRNNRDGTFTDVTDVSGLLDAKPADHIAATWVAAWSDVDNDGDLDLFLAQWGFKMPFVRNLMAKPRMDSTLFINENGHFVDRTQEFGLQDTVEDSYFIGATFGDYDNDGYPDLFLSSPLRNTSVLLRNISGRRFERTNLIPGDEGGFVASFLDFNHDGRLDLFWAGFADAKTSTEQAVFGEHLDNFRSGQTRIFIQTADGKFTERADLFDLRISTMGSSFGDINNDGCYDFYMGKGTPESWFVLPNLMYLGKTSGTKCADALTNISMLQGFGTIQKGHGIVFFDFDNDGDEDIYSSLGGMWPADKWPNQFFVNNSKTGNHWIEIRLRGRRTNYFGVGARVKVMAENQQHEEITRYYQMDNKTGFGSAPYLAHIGLMNASRIEGVEVYWPVSRCRKIYRADLDKLNNLDEQDCFSDSEKPRP